MTSWEIFNRNWISSKHRQWTMEQSKTIDWIKGLILNFQKDIDAKEHKKVRRHYCWNIDYNKQDENMTPSSPVYKRKLTLVRQ